ncbi:hypothetical protein HGRIS_011131 [Hohenbuehelia grisea]|uniref:F-box domain-containing protein n=1 Tax=Hohenbuehelia grisea TaxID=104357 RepID=A0ABR3IZC3_9AGAR
MSTSPCPDCNLVTITQKDQFHPGASPVAALMNSNQRPSAAEMDKALAEIKRSSLELTVCDENIEHLEAHLQDLRRYRNTISRYLCAHKAVVSPLRRLPPEILATIMTYTLPNKASTFNPQRQDRHGMLMLALVSRAVHAYSMVTNRRRSRHTKAAKRHLHLRGLPPEIRACGINDFGQASS